MTAQTRSIPGRDAQFRQAWPRWAAVIAWMGLQYLLSDQPKLPGPGHEGSLERDLFNYGAHVASYAVLSLILARAIGARGVRGRGVSPRTRALLSALVAVAFSASDEYHQSLVPGRTASVYDLAVDAVGVIAGLALAQWLEGQAAHRLSRRLRHGTDLGCRRSG
jgi:VanZ family protein